MKIKDGLILIKGGGDLGSGCAARLHRAGFRLLITEQPQPTVIRRAVAFASAVYQGQVTVEDITARLVDSDGGARAAWEEGCIPVVIDPQASAVAHWQPAVLVDAIMAKCATHTRIADAPIVIAVGPGFIAGQDCHAVVETKRGHDLGRVYYRGSAAPDTRAPGRIGDEDTRRVLRAPAAGVFRAELKIGDQAVAGQILAYVDQSPVCAEIDGVVRGLLADGLEVSLGAKIGDVDPRNVVDYCFTISDKAWSIGGGVLEAILHLTKDRRA